MNKRRGRAAYTLDIAHLERKQEKLHRRIQKLMSTMMAITDIVEALKAAKANPASLVAPEPISQPSADQIAPVVETPVTEVTNVPTEG